MFATWHGHDNEVVSVAFSPDGVFLASGSQDGTVKVWDVQTGGLVITLEGHSSGIFLVTFHPAE